MPNGSKKNRRSSILKVTQTTTAIEHSGEGRTRRRVSFHHEKIVQEFDKDRQNMSRSPMKEPIPEVINASRSTEGNSTLMALSTPGSTTADNATMMLFRGMMDNERPPAFDLHKSDMSISMQIDEGEAEEESDQTLNIFSRRSDTRPQEEAAIEEQTLQFFRPNGQSRGDTTYNASVDGTQDMDISCAPSVAAERTRVNDANDTMAMFGARSSSIQSPGMDREASCLPDHSMTSDDTLAFFRGMKQPIRLQQMIYDESMSMQICEEEEEEEDGKLEVLVEAEEEEVETEEKTKEKVVAEEKADGNEIQDERESVFPLTPRPPTHSRPAPLTLPTQAQQKHFVDRTLSPIIVDRKRSRLETLYEVSSRTTVSTGERTVEMESAMVEEEVEKESEPLLERMTAEEEMAFPPLMEGSQESVATAESRRERESLPPLPSSTPRNESFSRAAADRRVSSLLADRRRSVSSGRLSGTSFCLAPSSHEESSLTKFCFSSLAPTDMVEYTEIILEGEAAEVAKMAREELMQVIEKAAQKRGNCVEEGIARLENQRADLANAVRQLNGRKLTAGERDWLEGAKAVAAAQWWEAREAVAEKTQHRLHLNLEAVQPLLQQRRHNIMLCSQRAWIEKEVADLEAECAEVEEVDVEKVAEMVEEARRVEEEAERMIEEEKAARRRCMAARAEWLKTAVEKITLEDAEMEKREAEMTANRQRLLAHLRDLR